MKFTEARVTERVGKDVYSILQRFTQGDLVWFHLMVKHDAFETFCKEMENIRDQFVLLPFWCLCDGLLRLPVSLSRLQSTPVISPRPMSPAKSVANLSELYFEKSVAESSELFFAESVAKSLKPCSTEPRAVSHDLYPPWRNPRTFRSFDE
ncbi:hypothetical protein NPIL_478981 [Nephila pilipes]|uniref:Uncharacterized protein n=1 Tax=Nephila pilipes TaxID=299642 RepID=A0A8X6Q332_NEPPI|nr:hypothetical protein NPIL_478981 [Nephila pilipes]